MDNMGEAADLHRGIWPTDQETGSHYSVTEKLPTMLDLLDKHNIHATYFIEAWNCAHYPEVIKTVRSRGHEVGFHAYQHEVWKSLDQATELANLDKSVALARGLGIAYKGFRPPGGLVTERTLGLMRERGLRYLSPAAAKPAVVDGVAMVPFEWPSIDAYFYMASTASLRTARGDGEEVLAPAVLKERLCRRVDRVVEEGGFLSLLFHPFLQTSEERMRVMDEVLAYVKSKGDQVWVPKCEEAADWILKKGEESFGNDPEWDRAEWKKK